MGDRRRSRSRTRTRLAALARAAALVLPLAIVLWWFLLRERPEEAPPAAERELGPPEDTIMVPPPPAPGEVPIGIRSFEREISARLAADRPRVAPLTGPLSVRLLDVRWEDRRGRPFFEARAVLALLDAGALQAGNVVAHAVTLSGPELVLERRRRDEPWNYESVLAGLLGEEEPPTARNGMRPRERAIVLLRNVRIEAGDVVVRPPGPDVYRFREIDARLPRVALSVPGQPPAISIARITTVAEVPVTDRPLVVALRDGLLTFPEDRLEFDVERLQVAGSVFADARGEWRPGAPGLGVEATLRAERLRFADVRFLVPELPPEGVAQFTLEVEPLVRARTALRFRNLSARAVSSQVAGALDVAIGGTAGPALLAVDLRLEPLALALVERFTGPLPYDGTLRGRVQGTAAALTFDLVARLTAPGVAPFTAGLAGRAVLAEAGFAIRSLDVELRSVPLAALRPLAPGLPLRGLVSGRISLRGEPGEVPLLLDVTLTVAGGSVVLVGSLDLTGPVPAYDLDGRLVGVELQQILEPEVPPVALTANFSVVGSGLDLERMAARLRMAGRFTGWETGPADSLLVRAAVEDGVLALETLEVDLATLALDAEGTWRFTAPAAGGVEYRLVVSSLEPFGPYLPFLPDAPAGGSLQTAGMLAGTLDAPRVEGEIEADRLRYGEWAARAAEARYALTLAGPLPDLRVHLTAQGVETPGGAVYDTAVANVVFARPRFTVDVEAARAEGSRLELAAEGRLEADGRGEALVRRLILELEEERWVLDRPATIEWGAAPGVVVRNFLAREVAGPGRIAVEGRIPPTAEADLRVDIAALPVDDVLRFLGREPTLTGELWAEIRARGPREAPRVVFDFRLVEGRFRTLPVSRLQGEALFEGQRLVAEATAGLDTAGAIELRASIPMALDLDLVPQFRLLDTQPLRVSLVADSLSLSAIGALTPEIQDAEGTARIRATVTGTPASPRLAGAVQVRNAAATVPALNQRYEEITADIVFQNERALIRQFRARSDGWANATGTITFEEIDRPVADITVTFDEFRAIGVEDQTAAAVWGELRIAGDLRRPVVTGEVTLNDGTVMVPRFGADALAEEIGDVDEPAIGLAREPGAAEPAPWFEDVLLDEVIVEAGDALWFATEQARVQLTGELILLKMDEDLRIFGSLEGERGTFTLRVGPIVRRFDIVRASVRFFGSPDPNPAIDITASRTVIDPAGRRVEILIRIGGTLNAPTVALTTPEGAPIPESELLSFLLFGQPSFALADGGLQGGFVEEALFGVGSLAEILSIELEEELVADLGLPLDYFQIRPTAGPFGGLGAPTVVFGTEVAEDVFLTVDAGLATLFGPTEATTNVWAVRLEWRIDPEWTLELGLEPVNRGRLFRGITTGLPVARPEQQFILELRRRWTY